MTVVVCLFGFGVYAQEAAVTGHVMDEEGTPLIGATVSVPGAVIGTTTDVDGHYEIEVPPGRIRLLFTYLGYRNADTTVVVGNNDREIELDIVMKELSGTDLPELIVFGIRASGQSQALRLQQSSLSAQTIIHSELFNKYPDVTIAETVSRMPGVSIISGVGEGQIVQVRGLPEQYTAVALNGQRLPTIQPEADQVGTLDLIQSNLVEEVRVIKARTGDMDGDAIGGTVDFRTRTPERRFEVLAQAGIGQNFGFDQNPGQGTGVSQFTGVINSEISEEKIYALGAVSYLRQGRGTQQSLYDYTGNGELFASRPSNIDRTTERRGFVGAIEFRPSIYNRLKLSYNFATTREDIINRQLFVRNRDDGTSDIDRRTSAYGKDRQLELVSLEAENNFPMTRLDYQLSFSQTREDLENRLSNLFGSSTPGGTFPGQSVSDLESATPNSLLDGSTLSRESRMQDNIGLEEDVAILSLNITRYVNQAKTSFLRIGGRYRTRDRTYGAFQETDVDAGAPSDLPAGDSPDVLSELLVDETPDLATEALRYAARQRIQAYYLMYAANFTSRFSASAGLRYEGLEIETYETDQDTFGFTEDNLLPSINFTYRTSSNTKVRQVRQVRLSLYQAVARVNYSTYLSTNPLPLFDLDQFSIGNQEIQNTTSNNIDLTFERFGRRDGLISAGIYYKTLDNPTLRVTTTNYDSQVPTYETTLINTSSADLVGVELGFYQSLHFLGETSFWRFFNINGTYNFNALSAESRRFNFADFTLPQAPRQTANLSFVYSNSEKGINIVAATNFRDKIFDRVLDDRPIYKNALFSVDLAADYRFYKDFSVYLRANNLTDHPFREFFGDPEGEGSLLRSSARFGTWGVIGVRYQPR